LTCIWREQAPEEIIPIRFYHALLARAWLRAGAMNQPLLSAKRAVHFAL